MHYCALSKYSAIETIEHACIESDAGPALLHVSRYKDAASKVTVQDLPISILYCSQLRSDSQRGAPAAEFILHQHCAEAIR